MIIYITGYGRSGSTALSQEIERKLNACNLGEVKYLYRNNKDDLLDSYWLNFKKENKDLLIERSLALRQFDNVFGFLKWRKKEAYRSVWQNIFDRAGLNIEENIVIDSSKTTLDAFMRGLYLYYSFDEVYFIQPRRKLFDVVKSLLKGKNSNLERGDRKGTIGRFFHTLLVGVPHLLLTKVLTQIYRLYGLETIRLDNIEADVESFIERKGLSRMGSFKKLPMVYGNRSRNK